MTTQWRYWRWQVVRNVPLVVMVIGVVSFLGSTAIGLIPRQQTAASRLVLETPLAFNETPRAARSSQDVQHLQVVVHSLKSSAGRGQIAQTFEGGIPLHTHLETEIVAGRDKPTNLIITAHAQNTFEATKLAAVAAEFAQVESSRLQRDRVEASLTNLKTLVSVQTNALAQANQNMANTAPPSEQEAKARLTQLERQAQQIEAQIAGQSVALSQKDPALIALQKEMSKAKGIYSDRHPKVRLLQARIAQFSDVTAAPKDTKPLERQRDLVRAEIEKMKLAQADHQTAIVAQADASNRLAQSKDALTQARLRGERSVTRLKLVEDATLQTASRQKKLLALYAALALTALAISAAIVFLRIKSDKRLRRSSDLTRSLGLTPFATIPHLGPQLT